jgi:hypothetical protein
MPKAVNLSLLAQISVLAAQPTQLLTLGRGEPVGAAAGVQVSVADPLAERRSRSDPAPCPTVLPVERISSTTSAFYSSGKNRRGRGIGLPISRAKPSSLVVELLVGHDPVQVPICSAKWPSAVARLNTTIRRLGSMYAPRSGSARLADAFLGGDRRVSRIIAQPGRRP